MASAIAAQSAAWDLRLGHRAGPLGPISAGSGDSPNGTAVQVELYVQGVWQDITSFVLTRDGSQKINITRGQPDEASRVNAGRCAFQLNNRDGRFSPRNPNGPYFGQLGRNQPLRVSVQSGNAKSYRFWGEVPAWPQKWDKTRTDVWVEVEAAGLLRRVGQGTEPLKSALYRGLTSATLTYPPVAYWPCEDVAGATSIASAIGGSPMAIGGTPTLHSSTVFLASDSLPVMGSGSFTGAVPGYSPTGQTEVRFLLAAPAAGSTNGSVVFSFITTGTAQRWELYYGTGGNLGLRAFTLLGASVGDSGFISFAVDGKLLRVSIELTEVGGNINWGITTLAVGATNGSAGSGTFNSATVLSVSQVSAAPNGDQTNTVIGHISIQTTITSIFDLSSQLNAFIGETGPTRIQRLLNESGYAATFASTGTGDVNMGAQAMGTLISLVQECIDADMGTFFENRGSLGFGYRTRAFNYNQPPNVALDYSATVLSEVPTPIDDDRYTRNDITVSRTSGSFFRKTLDVGALSTLPPPNGVGRYNTGVTVNLQSDTQLPDQAGWRIHLATVDEPRYPVIQVNLARAPFVNNPVLRQQVLAIDAGWRMTVINPPPELPPDTISQIVLGITETIDHFQHYVSFTGTPESPYRVAIADDVVLAVADTDGTTLTLNAGPSDTSLTVTTADGFPLWTTDGTQLPVDITMGGERMTLTAVSGSVNPQTFTVTRSVNGIVKSQVPGTDIRLFQPAIAAL